MRRLSGLVLMGALVALGAGCHDFDAFATGSAGSGGGATTTTTTTTGSGGSGGSTTGSGGSTTGSGGSTTGSGGGDGSCFSDTFDSSGATTAVFSQFADTGTSPTASIVGGRVTFTSDAVSRGGLIMASPVALSDCYLSAEVPAYGDGVATFVALYKSDNPLERIEIAITPLNGSTVQSCVTGLIDGSPIASCQNVPDTIDALRIRVSPTGLVLEALAAGVTLGNPASTVVPSWIGSTKVAFGVNALVGFGNGNTSEFESLGGTPP